LSGSGCPAIFGPSRDSRFWERRNPLFDGVTTGVVAGDNFFYMANIQDDKKSGFNPIIILKVHLQPANTL
jgi:hypothetical protein